MEFLVPKDWGRFQHYSKRNPPWIKLHFDLLDNPDFQRLPIASRALAPMLWLMASKYEDAKIPYVVGDIAFRIRQPESFIEEALKPLIEKNFFQVLQDASNMLANGQQCATPETEKEGETKADTESKTKTDFGGPKPPAPTAPAKPKPPKAENPIDNPSGPVITSLVLNDGTEYHVQQSQTDEWQRLFPKVDVVQQVKEMRSWLIANKKERKTRSGILRFVNSWLAKEQNRNTPGNRAPQTMAPVSGKGMQKGAWEGIGRSAEDFVRDQQNRQQQQGSGAPAGLENHPAFQSIPDYD